MQLAASTRMFATAMELTLTPADDADLARLVRATSTPAGIARRARCIQLLGAGRTYEAVRSALDVTDRYIARWKRRFVAGGVLALVDATRRPAGSSHQRQARSEDSAPDPTRGATETV